MAEHQLPKLTVRVRFSSPFIREGPPTLWGSFCVIAGCTARIGRSVPKGAIFVTRSQRRTPTLWGSFCDCRMHGENREERPEGATALVTREERPEGARRLVTREESAEGARRLSSPAHAAPESEPQELGCWTPDAAEI